MNHHNLEIIKRVKDLEAVNRSEINFLNDFTNNKEFKRPLNNVKKSKS